MATNTISFSASLPTTTTSIRRGRCSRRMASTHFAISGFSSFSVPQPRKVPLPQHHCLLDFTLHSKASLVRCLARFTSAIPFSPPADTVITTVVCKESQLMESQITNTRILRLVVVLAGFSSLLLLLGCGNAFAATAVAAKDSIRASRIGLKIATALRGTGWADEAIVFALATLPVLELRGAIPVGYWMQLNPLAITVLSITGNMVPVPFILLYLKKLVLFLSQKNTTATKFLDHLLQRARDKSGPVKEFQWLGLMLFVAVPFPGTGAWTGAIVASVLDMPFWTAASANFVGVVLAGLLVNLLVNLGLKYAVATGFLLFFVSTVMWSVLRRLKK